MGQGPTGRQECGDEAAVGRGCWGRVFAGVENGKGGGLPCL